MVTQSKMLCCPTCFIMVSPAGSLGGTGQLRRGRSKMPRDDDTSMEVRLNLVYLDCTSQLLSTLQPRSGRPLGQGLDLPQLRPYESRRRSQMAQEENRCCCCDSAAVDADVFKRPGSTVRVAGQPHEPHS
jgi:hypothetical protein